MTAQFFVYHANPRKHGKCWDCTGSDEDAFYFIVLYYIKSIMYSEMMLLLMLKSITVAVSGVPQMRMTFSFESGFFIVSSSNHF